MYHIITMQQMLCVSAAFCIFAPPVLLIVRDPRGCRAVALAYSAAIFFFTVGIRLLSIARGAQTFGAVPQHDLTPFWSYARFDQADIRWQVYMNVFLFIPFGFMLPWCSERLRRLWKAVLIAAVFSALTEAVQYVFRIGLCETDDVIHNTLGAVLGYGYWRLLSRIQAHLRGDK